MKKIISLLFALSLTACAAQYDGYSSKMNECGYPNSHYTKFHACMCERVTISRNADRQDYFAKTNQDLLDQMDSYQKKVDKKEISSKQAMQSLNEYISAQSIQEHQSNQTAGAITAVLLVGAAGAACASTGCLNGYHSYDGNCPCPYSLDAAGNQCGTRSAYSRSGGASPVCY